MKVMPLLQKSVKVYNVDSQTSTNAHLRVPKVAVVQMFYSTLPLYCLVNF